MTDTTDTIENSLREQLLNAAGHATPQFLDAEGQPIYSKLPEYAKRPLRDMKHMIVAGYHMSWPSDWREDYETKLYLFALENSWSNRKDAWGLFRLIPGGYSSYTYDPTKELEIMLTSDFQKFIYMRLDQSERERLPAAVIQYFTGTDK